MTTVDASGLASDLVPAPDARASVSSALMVTGGTGWNKIELANADGDVLNGGSSGHNTLVVNSLTNTTGVSFSFNLAASAGQNEVVAFGAAGTVPTATNFQNIDLSHLLIGGATVFPVVIGSPGGSTIIASANDDTDYDQPPVPALTRSCCPVAARPVTLT